MKFEQFLIPISIVVAAMLVARSAKTDLRKGVRG